MNRILILILGIAAGILAAIFWPRGEGAADGDEGIRSAYARALAYYLNETNADDRRARLELIPFSESHGSDPAWLLDMALIDLAELNHPVQGEDQIAGEPRAYIQLLQSAVQYLERARALAPGDDAIAFNLARTYKKLAPYAEEREPLVAGALELLKPLAESDHADPAALIQYAEILLFEREDHKAALEVYDRVVQRGAEFVPQTQFRIAQYRRVTCLQRLDREAATAELKRLGELYKENPKAKADALERGAYTQLRALGEGEPARPDPRGMNWRLVTPRTLLPAIRNDGFLIAPDLDGDCRRDVVMRADGGLRVLRNRRNGVFEDLTESAGLPAALPATAAAVGDLDNDGRMDLLVAYAGGVAAFLNRTDREAPTKWKFEEIPFPHASDANHVAVWDMDHDGDLDVFVDPSTNYRTALEETEQGVQVTFQAVEGFPGAESDSSLLLDVDDDDDVDLLVTGANGNCWFENLRQMNFRKHPLPDGKGLAAFDVDQDLDEEVWIGGTVYKFVDGEYRALFQRPALLDLDGDGLADEDPFAGLELAGALEIALATDLNGDGGGDLIVKHGGKLDVFMSRPDRPAGWLDVKPEGGASNAAGIGARLRLYAGDLRRGTTCRDGLVSFAVGRRTLVDCLLVRWSNGVEQGVVTPNLMQCLEVYEREGEVGSCPFVYAFDGERWHFIADVQSGVPLGLPVADGVYLHARSNETILVPGRTLQPVDGKLRLDVTEEFRELFYVDAVRLQAIDRPADVRPVLNEGFTIMTFPEFRVFGFRDLKAPAHAEDHRGRDVTAKLAARDGKHAVVFEKLTGKQYEGLAKPWSIDLDFGDVDAGHAYLVMDGWVEFPTASASIAASQSKTVNFQPPVLDLRQPDGTWKRLHSDPGFPAGKGKTVLVDLGDTLPKGRVVIRVSSTQRLHWDSFFLATGADDPPRLTVLPLLSAEHGFHGVGKRVEDPDGELPWRYSHDDLEPFFRWDQMPQGMLTRYGDVKELLESIDDRYPILASGDRIRLEFDAAALPPLPEGWVRDFCFTTEGWVKDADLNQAVRESVGPLPFHAMSKYPYDEAQESHPHPDWAKEWLTRPARRLVNPGALGAKEAETR